jgi:hypothetical protein
VLNTCIRNRSSTDGISSNSGDNVSVNYLKHLILKAASDGHFILSFPAFRDFQEGQGASQDDWIQLRPFWPSVGPNEGEALLYYGNHVHGHSDTNHNAIRLTILQMNSMTFSWPQCVHIIGSLKRSTNSGLYLKNKNASVALTHDDVWCSVLKHVRLFHYFLVTQPELTIELLGWFVRRKCWLSPSGSYTI